MGWVVVLRVFRGVGGLIVEMACCLRNCLINFSRGLVTRSFGREVVKSGSLSESGSVARKLSYGVSGMCDCLGMRFVILLLMGWNLNLNVIETGIGVVCMDRIRLLELIENYLRNL